MEQGIVLATSRYQAHDLIVASGLAPVRITLGRPKFRLRYELAGDIRALAPTSSEFRIVDDELFEAAYRSRLDRIGVSDVVNLLIDTNDALGGNGIVLLCFENLETGELCHRRVLADWLQENAGWSVPELT